jgi:hypothetical protein
LLLLADPQGITVNAIAYSLPRVGAALDAGSFRTADTTYGLSVTHAYNKRTRRTARLDYKILAPDVMDSSLNVPYTGSVYTVFDMPNVGISRLQQGYMATGFMNWLSTSGFLNMNRILDGES